jgi:four helix bundle protein
MGDGDFRRSLSIARGSVGELELGLRVASRLGITDEAALEKVRPLVRRVGGMITMLIRRMG